MLVPLQTLFGWPEARNPSALEVLALLAGLPIVVIVIAFAVAKVGTMAQISRTGGGVQASDPIWMGGRATSIMGGSDPEFAQVADAQRAQIEAGGDSGGPGTAEATPEQSGEGQEAGSESGTGGAGARW